MSPDYFLPRWRGDQGPNATVEVRTGSSSDRVKNWNGRWSDQSYVKARTTEIVTVRDQRSSIKITVIALVIGSGLVVIRLILISIFLPGVRTGSGFQLVRAPPLLSLRVLGVLCGKTNSETAKRAKTRRAKLRQDSSPNELLIPLPVGLQSACVDTPGP